MELPTAVQHKFKAFLHILIFKHQCTVSARRILVFHANSLTKEIVIFAKRVAIIEAGEGFDYVLEKLIAYDTYLSIDIECALDEPVRSAVYYTIYLKKK